MYMDQRLSEKLKRYLAPGKRVHLVGIGGVSMRPLGLVLKGMGLEVTGSDMSASASTDELVAQGIHVYIGHQAENVEGATCVMCITIILKSPQLAQPVFLCLNGPRLGV